jgi:hypothetical protein
MKMPEKAAPIAYASGKLTHWGMATTPNLVWLSTDGDKNGARDPEADL